MAGATELVDQLVCKFLPDCMQALSIQASCLSSTAGSARLLFDSEEQARKLTAVWPMLCALKAPGLEVVQALVPVAEGQPVFAAIDKAERMLVAARQTRPVVLPQASPLALRNPRTALVATTRRSIDGDVRTIDLPGRAKRNMRDRERTGLPAICGHLGMTDEKQVPGTFDCLAGSERESLAIVHADGNGIGRLFLSLAQRLKEEPDSEAFYKDLCLEIEGFSREAAKQALAKLPFDRDKPWPVLPIVLAGDDLTLVLRADLAFDFAENYLERFEELSAAAVERLKRNHREITGLLGGVLKSRFTAGAGMVLVKRRYPYARAHALAESLAAFSKARARQQSSLAFHAVSASTVSEDFATVVERELLSPDGRLCVSMAPYVRHKADGLATLASLKALAQTLRDLPRGPVRGILTHLHQGSQRLAERDWQRMGEIASSRGPKALEMFDAAKKALEDLGCDPLTSLPKEGGPALTPWGDALLWAGYIEPPPQVPGLRGIEINSPDAIVMKSAIIF